MDDSRNIDNEAALYRMKKLLSRLSLLKSSGSSSVITLIIRAGENIAMASTLITREIGAASNIKSRETKNSVHEALVSAQQKLKIHSRTPPNGLVVLCGNVEMDGKEKKLSFTFEPLKPAKDFVYKCDNVFHLESISQTLEGEGVRIGVILICGEGTLYAVIEDEAVTVLKQFEVDLPKKHGRGGQSQLRFSRLAEEARHNLVRKSAECANVEFISSNRPNISKLIIAGNGVHKNHLVESLILDYRLQQMIVGEKGNPTLVDTSYPFEGGLREVMTSMKELIRGSKLDVEREKLGSYFDSMSKGAFDVCYGLEHTLYAMRENLLLEVYVSKNCPTLIPIENIDAPLIEELRELGEVKTSNKVEVVPLSEYAISYGRAKGVKVSLFSDATPQGGQFLTGFGGIGGKLRYAIDLTNAINDGEDSNDGKGEESDDDDVWWDGK